MTSPQDPSPQTRWDSPPPNGPTPHPGAPYDPQGWPPGYGGSREPYPPVSAPRYAAASNAPAPRRGWIVALVAVVLCFLLMFFAISACTAAFNDSMSAFSPFATDEGSVAISGDAVAVIEIVGEIGYDGTTSSPEGLSDQLDYAEQNADIKAVVLRVNSGGGTATAGEEMAAYVRQFSKPVVVSSASMNASAAYEISSQADYIFTDKSTAIGAIGTAMQVTDVSGLLDKLGISIDNITSSESKDSSYGTRPLTEEEQAYYQRMVDQINSTFVETVAEGRSMSVEEVRALATGLTFTGIDAVENGLADEIGLLEDAIDKAAELSGAIEPQVVYLRPDSSSLSSLLDVLGASKTDENSSMNQVIQ